MKRFFMPALVAVALVAAPTRAYCSEAPDTLALSLREAIDMARVRSVDAAVVLDELRTAYWQWRTFRADQLPELAITAKAPAYAKQYSSYMNENGDYSFVRTNTLQATAELSVSQNIPLTGGRVSLVSSLDFLRQFDSPARNRFMSIPVAITLEQPLFGTNDMKWERRIEPVRYTEAKAAFLSATVAQEKRRMGQISKNDLLQMELNLLEAQAALTDSRSTYKSDMFRLRAFLDLDENTVIVPVVPSAVPHAEVRFADALDKALTNNKFARSILRRQLEADYEVARAKGDLREINLFVQLGYTGTGSEFDAAYSRLRSNEVASVGFSIPLVDWGKRRGKVKVAESNRRVTESENRRQTMNFNQELFILVERLANQQEQLRLADRSDEIAQRRYLTNVETYMVGALSTLELNDSRLTKDNARRDYVSQLYKFWQYWYQLRSLTLHDFSTGSDINADFDRLLRM